MKLSSFSLLRKLLYSLGKFSCIWTSICFFSCLAYFNQPRNLIKLMVTWLWYPDYVYHSWKCLWLWESLICDHRTQKLRNVKLRKVKASCEARHQWRLFAVLFEDLLPGSAGKFQDIRDSVRYRRVEYIYIYFPGLSINPVKIECSQKPMVY